MPSPSQAAERDGFPGFSPTSLEMNHLIVELTGLLESASTAEEFFIPYLERVMEITRAVGVAVWQRQPGGHLELLQELNFGATNLDRVANGLACHSLLLEEAALSRRGHWVSP